MFVTKNNYTINIIPKNWKNQRGMNVLVAFDYDKKPVFTRFMNEKTNINDYIDNKHDYYITLNTFRTRKRTNDNIAGLNAVYIDVDCLKYGVSKEKFFDLLPQVLIDSNLCYGEIVLTASYVVDSGHGFYLVFLFKNQVIVNNPAITGLWSKLEKNIINKLNKACRKIFNVELCDSSATDPARLLRVPGTYNLKDRKHPLLCHIVEDSSVRYDMFKLVGEILPPKPPKKSNKGKRTKINLTVSKNAYTLNLNRCKDIESLIAMRNFSMNGYREILLFIYATHAVQILEDDKAIEKLEEINDSFTSPLDYREIKNLAYEIKYLNLAKYKYTSQKIINDLDITAEEQKRLKTIIGKEEKYRRNNKRRNDISKTKGAKAKKAERNQRIMELHNQGLSNTQIAKELEINRRTVYTVLNK
jgi:DNA-binding CsgD family transcriptional regulator